MHVDNLTELYEPQEFVERWAAITLEDEQELRLSGVVAATISNRFTEWMVRSGMVDHRDAQWMTAEDFVRPAEMHPVQNVLDADVAEAKAKARYG